MDDPRAVEDLMAEVAAARVRALAIEARATQLQAAVDRVTGLAEFWASSVDATDREHARNLLHALGEVAG